jgi:hypothetical protein
MWSRGLNLVLVLLIPALLFSAQCDARCRYLTGSSAGTAKHAGCHQHAPEPGGSQQNCQHHQTPEFSSPEQAVDVTHAAPTEAAYKLAAAFALPHLSAHPEGIPFVKTAPPGWSRAEAFSILRV